MYLVQSGRVMDQFINVCSAAVGRGVRVFVLFDAYGATGFSRTDRRRFGQAGVQMYFYNPLRLPQLWRFLRRDHRKILVVDQDVAFVGGVGLTDDFDPVVRGPVVHDWWRAFADNLAQVRDQPVDVPSNEVVSRGHQRGRVALSAAHGRTEVRRAAVNRIRGAVQCVWLATAYFVPSWKIRRALRGASRRGIDVRILLPGPYVDHPAIRHAGRRYYGRLLRSGVRIFEYQPRFFHAKTLICDDWVSIGSANVDRWNLRWNLEANQEIEDAGFAADVVEQFARDLSCSTEMTHMRWHRRGVIAKSLERFWGTIDRLIDRWLRRS
jgi:phosphatidylserine/phosphatidylglycerophosphate/cardiolipin synthase-like enzyme